MTETFSDILKDLGHHVEVANDGFKAIEKIKAQAFDVILMDIKMPGINGVETFKKIKGIRPEATVMMMTAYSVEDLVAEALKEGAYGIMYKPVNITEVVEFIESIEKSALILIVDDDLSTCESLMDVLKEKGYRIAKASNGQEAITMVREAEFDLVFIDVKMPVMNGLEIYLALKKIRSDIKVIMMTGYRQEVQDLVGEAIKNNAYTCIYKPFDIGKVLLLIEEILFKKPAAEISRTEVN
jgi:DNA-binding NtrC family response regulator